MNSAFFRQLLDLSEEYEQFHSSGQPPSIHDFARWVSVRTEPMPLDQWVARHDAMAGEFNVTYDISVDISDKIVRAYKFAKMYVKQGLATSPLLTFDDFQYLGTLLEESGLTKMELIERNISEKPAGMLVIKRLLDNGLIEQVDHEIDKRSKRLFVTENGKREMGKSLREMTKAARLVTAGLTDTEKLQLFSLLQKVDDVHLPIYMEHNELSLDERLKHLQPDKSLSKVV